MNDLRMLLEEQNARNNLLEKKQRKFDAECQSLQVSCRHQTLCHSLFYINIFCVFIGCCSSGKSNEG